MLELQLLISNSLLNPKWNLRTGKYVQLQIYRKLKQLIFGTGNVVSTVY